jgi:hypothetical protein
MTTRTTNRVIAGSFLTLFFLILSFSLQAGGRRRVVAASSAPPMTIEFLGTAGVLDAGRIAWNGRNRNSTIEARTVAMRIGPQSREARGTVTLYAFLEVPDAHATVRVNGVVLSSTPRVVMRDVPVGIRVTQRLEIEIPKDAPEGALQLSIGWAANE